MNVKSVFGECWCKSGCWKDERGLMIIAEINHQKWISTLKITGNKWIPRIILISQAKSELRNITTLFPPISQPLKHRSTCRMHNNELKSIPQLICDLFFSLERKYWTTGDVLVHTSNSPSWGRVSEYETGLSISSREVPMGLEGEGLWKILISVWTGSQRKIKCTDVYS